MEKIKYLYRAFRYKYKLDPTEINYITQNLNAGDIGVDVGSHKGGYLYWLQKSVGKNGKVYAFEPQPKLFGYLKNIIQQSDYNHITLENLGMSFQPDRLDFFIPKTKSGSSPGARIGALGNENNSDKIEVAVTTLDDYFFKNNIFPKFIKIDVEGHELQVLQGGQQLFQKCRPKILMECENRHLNKGTVHDVFDSLLQLGYQGYFIEHKTIKPLKDFDLKVHQKNEGKEFWKQNTYVNNFIFE